MGVRPVIVAPESGYQPSQMAHKEARVIDMLLRVALHERNRVYSGLMAGTPTTASSQITGAGNTTWNIDLEAGMCAVDGVAGELPEVADYVVHSGSCLLTTGQAIYAALVVRMIASVLSIQLVKGAAAAVGLQVEPTEGEIQAAVGAGVPWIQIARLYLYRSADTVVSQTQDNTYRPMLGINVDTTLTI